MGTVKAIANGLGVSIAELAKQVAALEG